MVYEKIKEYLCSGEIKTDETVSERDMAKKFDVKRGVVREILIQLEGEGLVNRIPLKGYKLNDYSKETREEVQAIRKTVEVLAARRAALYADREDIVRLTIINEELEEAFSDGGDEEREEADRSFHAALVKASKSELLANIFSFIQLPIFPENEPPATRKVIDNSIKGHRLLLESIKDRNPELAGKLMEEHFSKETVWYD